MPLRECYSAPWKNTGLSKQTLTAWGQGSRWRNLILKCFLEDSDSLLRATPSALRRITVVSGARCFQFQLLRKNSIYGKNLFCLIKCHTPRSSFLVSEKLSTWMFITFTLYPFDLVGNGHPFFTRKDAKRLMANKIPRNRFQAEKF